MCYFSEVSLDMIEMVDDMDEWISADGTVSYISEMPLPHLKNILSSLSGKTLTPDLLCKKKRIEYEIDRREYIEETKVSSEDYL